MQSPIGKVNVSPSMSRSMGHPGRHLIFAIIALGTFMATLDASAVNVALPTLAEELESGFGSVEWVVLSYLLALAALQLNMGRVGDLYGRGRTYSMGMLIFGLSSAACAASTTVGWLVAARVAQGVGGAIMNAVGPAILIDVFPLSQRGRVLGISGLAVSAGLAAGPAIGGFILSALSWHWIFLVNVPIAVAGCVVAWRTVPDGDIRGGQRLDIPGAALLTVTMIGLLLAVSHGSLWLGALSAVLFGAFVLVESRTPAPVVDLQLFRNRLFTGSALAGLLIFVTVGAVNLVMPFFLSEARGLEPREMGLVLTALPVALAVSSPLAGWLADRTGAARAIATTGALFACGGLILLIFTARTASPAGVALCLGILGIAVGTFQSPNNILLMGAVPRERLGTAGGLLATVRVTGMLLGNQVGATAFQLATSPGDGLRAASIVGAMAAVCAAAASLARGRSRA